jgi:hypothetical protein
MKKLQKAKPIMAWGVFSEGCLMRSFYDDRILSVYTNRLAAEYELGGDEQEDIRRVEIREIRPKRRRK